MNRWFNLEWLGASSIVSIRKPRELKEPENTGEMIVYGAQADNSQYETKKKD